MRVALSNNIVAKRFHQQYDLDYIETFSPVVKPSTIHIGLTLALTYIYGPFIILILTTHSYMEI